MSAAWMVLKSSSATPTPSTLMRWGWNRASGASKRSPPTLITLPSGSWGHTQTSSQKSPQHLSLPVSSSVLKNQITYSSLKWTDRVRLDQHRRLQRQLLLLFDVITDVAKLLLHHPHRLEVGWMVEGVASQQQQLMEDRRTDRRTDEQTDRQDLVVSIIVKALM